MTNTQTDHPKFSFRPRVEQSPDSPMRLRFLLETVFKSSTHLGITIQWGVPQPPRPGPDRAEVTGSC
jgi:hypothetical protein